MGQKHVVEEVDMHRINWGVGGMMYDFVNYVYVWHVLFHMNESMV